MLQQTQVATVIPHYHRFLARFPSLLTLADADIDHVLQYWQGLGYYARARNLHRAASIIRDQHQGTFPTTMESVLALPGIGRSTAAAILTFALGQSWPILDGNLKRVLSRCFQVRGFYGQSQTQQQLWQHSERLTPAQHTADYNQAMMDLGATVCLSSRPRCDHCPLTGHCQSYQQQTQAQFPEKKSQKLKPQKHTWMLLQKYQDQVLLYRRPERGIWGGLWSLPEVSNPDDIENWQTRALSTTQPIDSISENLLKHQFTHFSLDISIAHIQFSTRPQIIDVGQMTFVPYARLAEFGLPTPVRKILSGNQTNMSKPSTPPVF